MSKPMKVGQAGRPKEQDQDYVLLDCCRDATGSVLAFRHWRGDRSKVQFSDVFSGTYGYTDEHMPPFTLSVNIALNQLLAANGRQGVKLATGPGQVVSANATVGDFIIEVYLQARAQP